MKMGLNFDFSFVDLFIKNQNNRKFVNHKSMDIIYSHYLNFNTNKPVLSKADLVRKTINSFSGKSIHDLITARDYVKNNAGKWKTILVDELKSRIPISYVINSTIYFSISYDMGIAFNDDVVIDLSYSYYQQNPEEIVYSILHELSHVVLLTYHKPLNYSLLKTRNELLQLVRFNILLEGLGMIFPYELRIKDKNLMNLDYQRLNETKHMEEREKRLSEIISELEKNSQKPITEKDWNLIDELSEKRIWYLIGAKMAIAIENNLGREMLMKCIIEGEDFFFELFKKIKAQNIINWPIQGLNLLK